MEQELRRRKHDSGWWNVLIGAMFASIGLLGGLVGWASKREERHVVAVQVDTEWKTKLQSDVETLKTQMLEERRARETQALEDKEARKEMVQDIKQILRWLPAQYQSQSGRPWER